MKHLLRSTVAALLAAAPSLSVIAATCSKQSPAHTVAVLELYTSEGCSSCPPADRMVSHLLKPGLSLDQVVPLSLHVDYWDYIGWKDVYADSAFTARQRWLSALANSRTIYTPEVFVAGRELRDWHTRDGVPAAVKRINAQPAQAGLAVTLGKATALGLTVDIRARAAQAGKLFVALFQNELVSSVHAGENHGVVLRHDHVVRQWLGPFALSDSGPKEFSLSWSKALALPVGAPEKNLGVAAFIQNERGEILQALGLPLCTG